MLPLEPEFPFLTAGRGGEGEKTELKTGYDESYLANSNFL